jgi:hypothetical protein
MPESVLVVIAQASGQAGKSGQFAAFIQQRIRHIYRRQPPTLLPSRIAKSRHQSRLGVDGVDVAYALVSARLSDTKGSTIDRHEGK